MKDITFKADTSNFYGKARIAQYTYKDDTLSERHEELLERFPSKNIGDIRKLENTLETFNSSDIDMEEISELCLENNIVSPEVLLMDVMFKNDLKTASRNGITLLNIDGSLEVRNNGEKFLSPEETDLIKEYLIGEDDDVPPGMRGYDIARGETTTISGGGGGSMTTSSVDTTSFQGELKNVEMEFSHDKETSMKGEYVVSH